MAFLRAFAKNGCQYRNQLVPLVSNARLYCNEKLAIKSEQKHDWNRAVSDAEKIVGFVSMVIDLYLICFKKLSFSF